MTNIATRVNLKAPSIYSHFAGKDEILKQVIDCELNKYYTYLDAIYSNYEKNINSEMVIKSIFLLIIKYFSVDNRLMFWKNMLVVDQDNLRNEVSEKIYELELYHLSKLIRILSDDDINFSKKLNEDVEGSALLFLSMIQGALQGLLISHGTIIEVEKYIHKVWKAYWRAVHCC